MVMAEPKIRIRNVTYRYAGEEVLHDIDLDVAAHAITVLFGPAGGGKTTVLRLINRLNDLLDGTEMSGTIHLDDQDIYAPHTDVPALRRRVGMVFSLPLPLPGTVWENVTYGPRLAGEHSRQRLDEIVHESLSQAALWDEVEDRLYGPASALSGGQQQRLCIARSLAMEPDVLLLDEPTSGLDPISTAKVERSLMDLKQRYTIVLVPHNIQQGARVADDAAFFLMGQLVEAGPSSAIFASPSDERTEAYITGRFG